jgi:hypothetical protein
LGQPFGRRALPLLVLLLDVTAFGALGIQFGCTD